MQNKNSKSLTIESCEKCIYFLKIYKEVDLISGNREFCQKLNATIDRTGSFPNDCPLPNAKE